MRDLYSELKRRNVVRVGAAYLVMGWVIMQIVDVLAQTLVLPDWFAKTVLVLLLVGMPLALFFSWAFELTPQGVKKTAEVDADTSITPSTGRKLDRMIIAALVIAVAFLVYDRVSTPPPVEEAPPLAEAGPAAEAKAVKTIAVLPFVDMSPEKNQEYFADGISEELLNVLVRVEGLRVSSRTSSFSFKGKGTPIPEIAAALKVDHILEGSVRSQGNRVRITAQLIDVKTDSHLWSQTFDRELDDIFAIQDEISQAIVAALKMTLIGEGGPLVETSTRDMEAYNLYLRGLHQMARRTPESLKAAIELLDQAIVLDPQFADAYTTLGRVYYVVPFYTLEISFREAAEKGREATKRAIALAPDDPKALATSAITKSTFGWDFEGAARDFEKAFALSPNDPEIVNFYGDFLRDVMDLDRALEIEGRAVDLDPLSPIYWTDLGLTYEIAGNHDQAAAAFGRALAIDPGREIALEGLVYTHLRAGRIDEAKRRFKNLAAALPEASGVAYYRAVLAILDGDKEGPAKWIENYLQHPGVQESYPVSIAELYYFSGDIERTVVWLERAYERRNFGLLTRYEFNDPRALPDEPRILEILGRPGLKELMDLRRKNLGLDEAQ